VIIVMRMADKKTNLNRRKVLKQLGISGVSISVLGGIGSARPPSEQDRPSLLQNEVRLKGRERGQYISSVRSSDQFGAVKHALIDDGYTPHMGRPTPTQGTVRTTNNNAKQLVVPFKNHNNTDHTATAYGLRVAESSDLAVLANVNLNGGILRQYLSTEEILAQDEDGVRIVSFENSGGR
jgi:hypothetical protein